MLSDSVLRNISPKSSKEPCRQLTLRCQNTLLKKKKSPKHDHYVSKQEKPNLYFSFQPTQLRVCSMQFHAMQFLYDGIGYRNTHAHTHLRQSHTYP
jgi:hypothetical protein